MGRMHTGSKLGCAQEYSGLVARIYDEESTGYTCMKFEAERNNIIGPDDKFWSQYSHSRTEKHKVK